MINRRESDKAFWSLILEYSRDIFSIYKFIHEGVIHHFPVLNRDQFNLLQRVSKCAHDLGNLACFMLDKLEKDEG